MSLTTSIEEIPLNPSAKPSNDATFSGVSSAALPLGALLLAGSLAAGAQTVTAPTTTLQPVTVSGAHGVAHVLRLLRDELEIAMALVGVRAPDALRRDHLQLLPPTSQQGSQWTD